MNKRIYLVFICTLLFVSVLLMSCGGAKTSTTGQTTTKVTTTATTTSTATTSSTTTLAVTTSSATTTTTTTTTSKPPTSTATTTSATTTSTTTSTTTAAESLGDILGKAAGVSALKYDQVMTAGGSSTTQKVYVKKNKMRTEMTAEGQTTIMLADFDAKILYNYMPAQKMAIKMNISQAGTSASEQAGSSASNNPTILGTETIDGKVCLKVQYVANGATTTQWIWKQYGLPVRVESVSSSGTSIIEYKNYDFSSIDDSMFELPAGTTIISM